ncbi:uncharacterized protein LOC124171458 [Ischnura elegans]|uniref:uncharacterized protein LOC124171458 n=1 Tax=Ischnura elegans TaxID=197161 RepID=UPI001ED8A3BF|nr:uncharacterized protein LOC124171458 [Ischnura elegans]
MNKAGKTLRRSSVRLKALGSGHSDLNMVISQLKDVRSSAKAFMMAQNTAMQDLLKWSLTCENLAFKDVFMQLNELNTLWSEAQKDFTDHLKEFSNQFELILEGEKHVDQARNRLNSCELVETKIRKDLKKAAKKAQSEEVRQLEMRLAQAERSRGLAHLEVVDRIQENECIKMIRVKEGLLKLSESYIELAHKCNVIYDAQRDIAHEIPDVHESDIQEIKYTGSQATRRAVSRVKDLLRQYRRSSHNMVPSAALRGEPPPPYYPNLSDEACSLSHGNNPDAGCCGSSPPNNSRESSQANFDLSNVS